jgi:hypothetical protein
METLDDSDNDGRYPDGLNVLTPFPVTDAEAAGDRASWPWVTASIVSQCGPDEWVLVVEIPETGRLADGTPAPAGTPDDDVYYPLVFRDAGEIRLADPTVEELREVFFPGSGGTP